MTPRTREAAAERTGVSDETLTTLLRLGGVLTFMLLPWLGAMGDFWIPIGKYHVPITLQTLAVVLAAVCLGPRFGTIGIAGYVLLGAIGLPVFSDGRGGAEALLGYTAGYIFGFILCQPVIVRFIRRRDGTIRGWGAMIAGMLAGHAVIFGIGVPWLWASRKFWLDDPEITLGGAFYHGCVIFLPFMVIKVGIAVLIGKWAAPWASRRVW